MAITEEYNLILSRTLKRAVADAKVASQVASIRKVINRSREVQGYSLVPNYIGPEAPSTAAEKHAGPNGQMAWSTVGEPGSYQAELYLSLRYHNDGNEAPKQSVVDVIINGIADTASKPSAGNWTLSMVGDQEFEPFDPDTIGALKDDESMEYAPVNIPADIESHFTDHLYGLEAQVARLMAKVRAFVRDDYESRVHAVLIGPPGCGKTDMVKTLMAAIGEECFVEFDRTATTGPGAIKELDEVEVLPRFMFLDEGEKTTDTASNFMLSLLDDRSEIRKVTARKKIQRQIKLMAIACVNDEDDWNKLCKGALASRFGKPIYFLPPDHAMLRKICEREIVKVRGGSDAWIEPCLKYCLAHGWDQPRDVIALLKEGAEGWLDNSFAKIMDATTKPSTTEVHNWTK